jgi:hypothetical protein
LAGLRGVGDETRDTTKRAGFESVKQDCCRASEDLEKVVMMVPRLLKPSGIAVEFGQVQATREAFDQLGPALPGTVLFRVEDKMKVGDNAELLSDTFPILNVSSRLSVVNSVASVVK